MRKPAAPRAKLSPQPALAVDFDGTLQLSDLNWEGIIWMLRAHPLACLSLLYIMLRRGRAAFKMELQRHAEVDGWLPQLPWDERMVELMAEAKKRGREVIVATGSPQRLVSKILKSANL